MNKKFHIKQAAKQLTKLSYSVLTVLAMSSTLALADMKASYAYLSPLESKSGNDMTKGDLAFDGSWVVKKSENKRNIYSLGVSLLDTHLNFDDNRLKDLDLLKVKAVASGTHILSSKTILQWTLSPGWHGELNNLAKDDFRMEGQFLAILPRSSSQWVVGLGYGDTFGEPTLYPVIGRIMSLSDQSKLTLMFPLLKYEVTSDSKRHYHVSIQPDGSQWRYAANSVAPNTAPGDLSLTGIKFSVGADMPLSKNKVLFVDAGVVFNREVKIVNVNTPSRQKTDKLDNALAFQVGLKF